MIAPPDIRFAALDFYTFESFLLSEGRAESADMSVPQVRTRYRFFYKSRGGRTGGGWQSINRDFSASEYSTGSTMPPTGIRVAIFAE